MELVWQAAVAFEAVAATFPGCRDCASREISLEVSLEISRGICPESIPDRTELCRFRAGFEKI